VSIIKSHKITTNTYFTWKTRMGKPRKGRKRFHYVNGDYNWVFWCTRVSRYNWSSPFTL